jgi:hypothetical protein
MPSAADFQFFCCESVRSSLLIEAVKQRPERKKGRNTLNDLAEPSAFIICQCFAFTTVGLPVTTLSMALIASTVGRAASPSPCRIASHAGSL